MTETDYGPSFQIIAAAGDSKGYSMSAIKAAKTGDFDKARTQLKAAEKSLLAAHHFQTDMIAQEAGGNPVPVNIILVHSQDHLAMAMAAQDLAGEFVDLYEKFHPISQEFQELNKRGKGEGK